MDLFQEALRQREKYGRGFFAGGTGKRGMAWSSPRRRIVEKYIQTKVGGSRDKRPCEGDTSAHFAIASDAGESGTAVPDVPLWTNCGPQPPHRQHGPVV